MIIKVRVVAGSGRNSVEKKDSGLKVYTSATPQDNKANKAVVKLLAKFFNKRSSDISIIAGLHSRDKTVQID